jgi:TolB protein
MKIRRTLITVIIALAAAASLAATGSASRVADMPTLGQIAYFNIDSRDSGFDVMLTKTDGSDVTNITHDGTAKKNMDPTWSANGMKIAYTSYNASSSAADIIVVNVNGKGRVNLTGPAFQSGILNINPTWSPDGSIVFASNRDGNFDLYRIGNAASDRLVRMTKTVAPTQNLDPDYSADGKMLVFSTFTASATRGSAASLSTMRSIPGAPATKLTEAAFSGLGDRGAAWSPTGRQIAFYSDRAGNSNLYLINRDGSGLRQMTSNKAADREPSWSSDGTLLVFLSDRSDYTELWMTPAVGMSPGEPVAWQVTFDKQLKGSPDWQPVSVSDRFPG